MLNFMQSELQVDDFLGPDDPRVMTEGKFFDISWHSISLIHFPDLTDRFDYTFVFGDLNFRLDITRRHADWLISRQGLWVMLSLSMFDS